MASNIDNTVPAVDAALLSEPIRNNFIAAKSEIEALQGVAVTNGNSHDHNGGDGAQIAYSSLSGLPTLGTAAGKNIPATGNASATEVVYGSDTRLADARTPASHTTGSHSDWPAGVSMTELGYLDGVTSALQTQLNAKGKVRQVVSATYDTAVTNSTTTYATTGLSQSITPAATTSKILVLTVLPVYAYVSGDTPCGANLRLKRDSTVILTKPYALFTEYKGIKCDVSFATLDSPASTSAITYAIEFASAYDPGVAVAQSGNSPSIILLMEIGE